jgi:putative salt-induced outer membrane protein
MKRVWLALLVLATLSLASVEAATPDATATPPAPPPLWNDSAGLSLLQTSGNTDVTTIGLSLESIYSPDPYRFLGKFGYLLNRLSGVTQAETYNTELRGERAIGSGFSGFVDGTFLRDTFSGFNSRFGAEAGVTYGLLGGPAHILNVELGVGGVFENRTDDSTRNFVSASPGIEYRWKFSPTAELSNTLKAIADLSHAADWRLNDALALTSALTSVLSAKIAFTVDYVNQPVAGKVSTDTGTSFALVAKF